MEPMIFDAHLDLSLNALEWNRDLRRSLEEIRKEEEGRMDLKGRENGVVSFPEMRRGNVGLCVATLIAGCMKPRGPVGGWNSPEQAWAQTQGQLTWYRVMEEEGQLRQIRDRANLEAHLKEWGENPEGAPIGYILSLEGADSLVNLSYLERAWESGLRALGPAHYGVGRYALGHDQDGPLTMQGRDLLREMDRLGMILDVTHLCDRTFWDALEEFEGPVWASHSNCRALVDDVRQFSDEQIRALLERGAVIGMALDAWMMVPGWVRGKSAPEDAGVRLDHVVDHMEHICELAGHARQVGIGSDLDGGFGREQAPMDLASIADLQKLSGMMEVRGFSRAEVEGVLAGNFLGLVRRAWGG